MKTRLFTSCTTEQSTDGWPMCYNAGCSMEDNKDYAITTNNLKGDEIPDECSDAKTFTQLMAGLLNAFYNNVDVSNMEALEVMTMGICESELNIPTQETELPFK